MPLPRLLLLSRQGSAGLPPEILARLNRVADVQAHRCEQAPTGDEPVRLLSGVDLLGAAGSACRWSVTTPRRLSPSTGWP